METAHGSRLAAGWIPAAPVMAGAAAPIRPEARSRA